MSDARVLARDAVALATRLGVRIATAESLTGGLLAAAIVAVPGASNAYSGGVIAYDTELKASLLGVDRDLLCERGPVDERVAEQMAAGVRLACAVVGRGSDRAEVGVSTTGVAGPMPDPQTGQPAGTVWLGVSSARGSRAVLLEAGGAVGGAVGGGRGGDAGRGLRESVREAAVLGALDLLLEELRSLELAQAQ